MNNRQLAEILNESKYLVCLSGRRMIMEDGIKSLRDLDSAYEIEAKYGYSPEELYSAQFFNTRVEKFYEFYREEVLSQEKEPGEGYKALAALEEMGILKSTITRQIFDFPRKAGCRNVFNLHGTITEKNQCPRCNREYPVEYLKTSGRVPLCESCHVPIHPGGTLLGEMVEIGLTTKAAHEVSKADTLLLAGTYMNTDLVKTFLHYYQGDKMILIHSGEHFSDREADYFINGQVKDVLPAVVEEIKNLRA